MKNIGLVTKTFRKNECFEESPLVNPVDDKYLKFRTLRKLLLNHNLNLETIDVLEERGSPIEAFIVKDFIPNFQSYSCRPSLLLAMESPAIEPDLFGPEYLSYFDCVLSWRKFHNIVSNYDQLFYHFDLNNRYYEKNNRLEKLFSRNNCIVCVQSFFPLGFSSHDYSERQKLILMAAEHLGNNFQLFGRGWDKIDLNNKFLNKLVNRVPFVRKKIMSYRHYYFGAIESKSSVLERANFALAVENHCEPGYFTEKLFDCFMSGTIPIYFGSSDVKNYIDESAFIFIPDFKNVCEALDYAQSLSDVDRLRMLRAAQTWMEKCNNTFELAVACDKIYEKLEDIINE